MGAVSRSGISKYPVRAEAAKTFDAGKKRITLEKNESLYFYRLRTGWFAWTAGSGSGEQLTDPCGAKIPTGVTGVQAVTGPRRTQQGGTES